MNTALILREFLGWNRPALPEAWRRLAQRYRRGETLDLSAVIVVVPGQRAGRRLQELLAFLAEDERLRLTPPDVVTEGRLPEMLYTPKQPFATEITQDLAWSRALRDLPADKRRRIVPHPPEPGQAVRWLELGAVLRHLHRELAADGLDFLAVHNIGPRLADFSETDRWAAPRSCNSAIWKFWMAGNCGTSRPCASRPSNSRRSSPIATSFCWARST